MSFLETKGADLSRLAPSTGRASTRAFALGLEPVLHHLPDPLKWPGGRFSWEPCRGRKPRHRVGPTARVRLVLRRPGPHGVAAGALVPTSAWERKGPEGSAPRHPPQLDETGRKSLFFVVTPCLSGWRPPLGRVSSCRRELHTACLPGRGCWLLGVPCLVPAAILVCRAQLRTGTGTARGIGL